MKQTIATSIEQSQRLMACGVDPKTADMCWTQRTHRIDGSPIKKNHQKANLWLGYPCRRILTDDEQRIDIPAWSTSRLLELLPEFIDGYWLTIQKIYENGRKYTYALGYLRCEYQEKENPDNRKVYSDNKLFRCASETIIEAIVKAIEWLTKDGYKLNEIEQ